MSVSVTSFATVKSRMDMPCYVDSLWGKKGGELNAAGLRLAAADTSTC